MTIFSLHSLPNQKFTGFGRPDLWDYFKIIDLDVQNVDLKLQINDLNVQIYDFWNNLKNLEVRIHDFYNNLKYGGPIPGFRHKSKIWAKLWFLKWYIYSYERFLKLSEL